VNLNLSNYKQYRNKPALALPTMSAVYSHHKLNESVYVKSSIKNKSIAAFGGVISGRNRRYW